MEYTLVGGTFAVKAVNTWGLGLISSNREGVKRYFHFDALGSTRALTDSSGNVTDTYEYNGFGVLESSSGSSVNPFRYVGQWGYYDDGAMGSSSGLLLLGVRYYSPAHGRFWSWDPVPNENLYAYVENSATIAIDPSGMAVDLCYCRFKGNVGNLRIDCSCAGKLRIWIIPERGKAYSGIRCNKWVDADGYVIDGRMYKIDGSTCVVICCQSDGTPYVCYCCVNLIAGAMGKRCPYRVPRGTFGSDREPGQGAPDPVRGPS